MKTRKPRTYLGSTEVATDPTWTLLEWRKTVNKLIKKYGPLATMETYAGYNQAEIYVTYKYQKEGGAEKIIKSTE